MSSTTTYHRDDEFGEVAYIGVEVFDGDDDGDLDLAVFDYYESAGLGGARLWVNDGTGAVASVRSSAPAASATTRRR